MKLLPRTLAVTVLASLATSAHAEIAVDVIGNSEVSFEGLFQADGNWFDNDVQDLNGTTGNDGKDTEFELRRAEVILKGKGTSWDWVAGYDAKANKFLDANIRYKMGAQYLQLGQYKQTNSMEELTSTRHNDFISKSMTTNLLGVARRTGIAWGIDSPNNWGGMVSAFGRELTRNLAQGQGWGARGYWAPVNDVMGGNTLHFGLSYVDFDTDADTLRLRVRPDADFATGRLVDTGDLKNTDRQSTFGAEALWFHGPWRVQGEYMKTSVDRYGSGPSAQDFDADSWYVYGLWNITGETWTYKAGVPVTGYPNDPAKGAWQLGVRYDAADLTDDPVFGGDESNWTVGVNWYWRANFKVMANYVMASSDKFNRAAGRDLSDDPNIFEVRAQFYW